MLSLCNWPSRGQMKCDGTRAETRFRISAKRTSPFKSAGASVQSTGGSRGVRMSCSNAWYTKFRGSVKGTGYPFYSPVSPSLPLPCVTVCHHISTGVYACGIAKQKMILWTHLCLKKYLLLACLIWILLWVCRYFGNGQVAFWQNSVLSC